MDFKQTEPPLINKGVLGANETSLIALVDWLQVTFVSVDIFAVIEDILGLKESQLKLENKSYYGYNKLLSFSDIKIYYNVDDDDKLNSGYHFLLTATACRQLDFYIKARDLTWQDIFKRIKYYKGHVSRLDLAIDDRKPYFDIKKLVNKTKNGEMVSRFRYSYSYEKIGISKGKNEGVTFYVGSPSSPMRFRFYQKNYQMASLHKVDVSEFGPWNRYEIQLRDEKANECVKFLAEYDNLNFVAKSILNESFRFVNQSPTDKDKRRWPLYRPWKHFINDAGRIKLSIMPEEKTVEENIDWLRRQVATTLDIVLHAEYFAKDEGLISEVDYLEFILSHSKFDIDKYGGRIQLFLDALRNKKSDELLEDIKKSDADDDD
ncbi:replication initiation factor domain-containing protein [Macrococcus armenti]|uniref:replication initiation factor domain-containing protein n=1 Tax=Macrococcus armenti TaxID=2875764 RepID=UPI001CC96F3D|nr:replication initiation factor domain-containing protein [Macrococcus armenti]UBH13591.1 replication initiation factor domain-containing protein [Macrococcus armenti]